MIFEDPPDEPEPTQAEIDAEAEIDAIAARDRDEGGDVRAETGYAGPAPLVLERPGTRCDMCNTELATALTPGGTGRTACPGCAGRRNRELVDDLAEAVRTLKTSDDGEAMKRASDALIAEFGRAEGREKIEFIARCRADGKYKPKQQQRGSAA